jgi:hypothetical protein
MEDLYRINATRRRQLLNASEKLGTTKIEYNPYKAHAKPFKASIRGPSAITKHPSSVISKKLGQMNVPPSEFEREGSLFVKPETQKERGLVPTSKHKGSMEKPMTVLSLTSSQANAERNRFPKSIMGHLPELRRITIAAGHDYSEYGILRAKGKYTFVHATKDGPIIKLGESMKLVDGKSITPSALLKFIYDAHEEEEPRDYSEIRKNELDIFRSQKIDPLNIQNTEHEYVYPRPKEFFDLYPNLRNLVTEKGLSEAVEAGKETKRVISEKGKEKATEFAPIPPTPLENPTEELETKRASTSEGNPKETELFIKKDGQFGAKLEQFSKGNMLFYDIRAFDARNQLQDIDKIRIRMASDSELSDDKKRELIEKIIKDRQDELKAPMSSRTISKKDQRRVEREFARTIPKMSIKRHRNAKK